MGHVGPESPNKVGCVGWGQLRTYGEASSHGNWRACCCVVGDVLPAGLAGVDGRDQTEETGGRNAAGVREAQVIQASRIVGLDLGHSIEKEKRWVRWERGKQNKTKKN